jgi:hypothetical protein
LARASASWFATETRAAAATNVRQKCEGLCRDRTPSPRLEVSEEAFPNRSLVCLQLAGNNLKTSVERASPVHANLNTDDAFSMKFRNSVVPFVAFVALIAACSSSDQSADNGSAGATSSAGNGTAKGGSAGSSAGGSANSSAGHGGASGSGTSSGGSTSSGGAGSSGAGAGPGAGASNGGSPSAGAPGAGGAPAGGAGNFAGAGGRSGNGGGGAGSAGRGGTGGSAGKGGTGAGGTAGMSGSGNAGSTSCSFPSSWTPSSPTYTTYSLPNAQTACGYEGSNNNISNIAVAGNYAAIPAPSSGFSTSDRCGACVQIGSAIVTIVDECPYDSNQNAPCKNNPGGHLDLSTNAASAGNVKGDPSVQGQNAWKFVPCPINGNVMVRLKNGNNNEIYIENEILPIASVTCDGQTGSRQTYGAWHFAANINGKSCTVTDAANRTISITVGNTQGQNVNSGVQFPKCN